ncbi:MULTISPECIES: TonB-dependent receptor [unclassified Novosphingobium]|uniref:TonB-dependent receptor n=1 Tax=unclassified Novosphingobium TaxID=2644732 RepID=UPI00146F17E7|nr:MULTISPECIES: TonB-dependent receptor [unclassified Novosphingobium]NMN02920.1 iron complex outermembrane receptor protein [Novosphingobium sp. SG919]NMN87093.1 iron complex outermembrane receptor protein [Novosphingobium sp. SG916]
MNSRILMIGACMPALLAAVPALAAEAQPQDQSQAVDSQEIVVTAQKRSENLRDTPAAVAVVAPVQLTRAGVTTIDDLGKAVPSLVAQPASTTLRPFYTLRGISTAVVTVGSPSGVAVMLDGVTLAPESLAARQLSDIASVEVLRGPQSTLGGRAASIGVINIVTRKPTDTFQGQANATITEDGEYRGSAFISGPLSETVGYTLSGFGSHTDSITRNLTTGQKDYSENFGVRGKLQWQPLDGLKVTLSGNYIDTRDVGAFQAYSYVDPAAKFRGTYAQSAALPGITPSSSNTDYATITTPGQHSKDQLYSLAIEYRTGKVTFTSLSAYSREKRDLRYDTYMQALDWASLGSGGTYSWNNIQRSQLDIRGFNQELRFSTDQLGPVRLLGGVYYDYSKTGFQFDRPAFGTAIPFGAYRVAENNSYAAYLRADWTLARGTTLTTGLRFNRDKIAYQYDLQYNTTPASATNQFSRTGSDSFSTLVGDVTLKQQMSQWVNVYAKYSRGYKPKVYNLDGTFTATNTITPVNKERVDGAELGMKGDFFDRHLSLNIAAFYAVYHNFQVQSVDPTVTVPTFQMTNAGKASTRGIEMDATVRAGQGLSFNFAGAYTNARYDSFVGANCYSGQTAAMGCTTSGGASYQDLSGKRLPSAPLWKFNAGAEKSVALNDALDANLGGVLTYQSAIAFSSNWNTGSVQGAYALLNLSAGIADHDERWSVTAFVNNVTDKRYASSISDVGGRWGNKPVFNSWYGRDAHRYAGLRLETKF